MVLPVQWTKCYGKTNRQRVIVFPGDWIRERFRGDLEPEQDVFEAVLTEAIKKKYPNAEILGFYSPYTQNCWCVTIEDESFREVQGLELLDAEIIDKE